MSERERAYAKPSEHKASPTAQVAESRRGAKIVRGVRFGVCGWTVDEMEVESAAGGKWLAVVDDDEK